MESIGQCMLLQGRRNIYETIERGLWGGFIIKISLSRPNEDCAPPDRV